MVNKSDSVSSVELNAFVIFCPANDVISLVFNIMFGVFCPVILFFLTRVNENLSSTRLVNGEEERAMKY